MNEVLKSAALLMVLLNPFLLIVYLIDIVEKLKRRNFNAVIIRASLIASGVFCVFSILGDAVFVRYMQVEFASFQIFGGVVFLLIGLQFVFKGPTAVEILQGESKHLAGAVAMPVFIGPGTISASVIIGKKHEPLTACFIVISMVFLCAVILALLKYIHDIVKPRNESLVERYIEIAGRVTALVVGTIAVDMIMRGIGSWLTKF
ncbi:MarC family protein [Pleionea sediminis]|uniref:MarC family protein n=1 Tax=Pleionea sediminis TaxID=2569479 RepID=UPI001185869B|nr:MarC family protein [Pleionea sediminis]